MKEQSCATLYPSFPHSFCSVVARYVVSLLSLHLKYTPVPLPNNLNKFSVTSSNDLQKSFSPPPTLSWKPFTPPQTTSFQQVLLALAKNRRYTTIATPKPLAIVAAKHERQVQATVICAKHHGLEIRIRSDGHDYEGLSYVSDVPFVILDMLNLRSIDVNVTEGRVRVQSGATVGELYYEVGKKSRVHGVAAGSCPC